MTVTVNLPPPTPDKYGGDAAAFDVAMQAWLDWQETATAQSNAQNIENNEINAQINASAIVVAEQVTAVILQAAVATTAASNAAASATNAASSAAAAATSATNAANASRLTIGTVNSGSSPAATITGNAGSQSLNLTLVKGDPGPQGPALGVSAFNSRTGSVTMTAADVNSAMEGTDALINGVSVGRGATPSYDSTAMGVEALASNTTGSGNSAFGHYSLAFNTTGRNNTASGSSALTTNTTGSDNTASGHLALYYNTTFDNTSGFGRDAQVTGDNQVQLGDSITTTYVYGTVQNRSDLRDKADVRDTTLGLDFIRALRPVDYRWDMREDYRPTRPAELPVNATEQQKAAHKAATDAYIEACKHENLTHDGSKKRNRYHHGLIAQEVKALLDAQGLDFGGYQDHKLAGGHDVLSIGYDELIAPLIKAVQELSTQNALLAARVNALEQ